MEITLEKIELVKDRTGANYKETKDALEQTDSNVVDAIIFIEDSIDEGTKPRDSKTSAVIDSLKSLIKKGNGLIRSFHIHITHTQIHKGISYF